jgi:hypothetical protein
LEKGCHQHNFADMTHLTHGWIHILLLLIVHDICRAAVPPSKAGRYFAIEVVDDQTERGVPAVELQTTSSVRQYTDSNGLIAFDEPGLMNRKVWFSVSAHGYEFAADGFGMRGVALETKPGGSAKLEIKRIDMAGRLYRITGQGFTATRHYLSANRLLPSRCSTRRLQARMAS